MTTEPTCTEAGEKTRTCSECGGTETKPVEALGHNYENGECARCHDVLPQTPVGFAFFYDNVSDSYYVREYTGSNTVVTVASTYNDGVHGTKAVTGIGESAFMDNEAITEVVLPDTIVTIGNYAFMNCTNLFDINIPAGATIGVDAFYGTNVYY